MTPSPAKSWLIFGLILLPLVAVGLSEFRSYQGRAAEMEEISELSQRYSSHAAKRATLEAELKSLSEAQGDTSLDWPGTGPTDAALLMQERVVEQLSSAGLNIDQIAPRAPDGRKLRLGIRAKGDIAAIQLGLFALETATPRLAIETLSLKSSPRDANLTFDAVILGQAVQN